MADLVGKTSIPVDWDDETNDCRLHMKRFLWKMALLNDSLTAHWTEPEIIQEIGLFGVRLGGSWAVVRVCGRLAHVRGHGAGYEARSVSALLARAYSNGTTNDDSQPKEEKREVIKLTYLRFTPPGTCHDPSRADHRKA